MKKSIEKIKLILRRLYIRLFRESYKKRIYESIQNTSLSDLRGNKILEPELLLLDQFLSEGDIVFDIGANIGHYTYQFEKIVGSQNVYAFEPIPALFDRLKKLFSKVNIFQIAFSDINQITRFKIPIINSHVFETRGKLDIGLVEPGEEKALIIDVKCEKLDDFVADKKLANINFIKIDVEGHELSVLRGAERAIIKFQPTILVEIEQRHHEFSINEIFEYIEKMGYRIDYFDLSIGKFLSREKFDVNVLQQYSYIKTNRYINNFWCIPLNQNRLS